MRTFKISDCIRTFMSDVNIDVVILTVLVQSVVPPNNF